MMKSSFEKCIGTDKIDKQDLFDREPEEEGHPKPNNTYIPFMATLLHLLTSSSKGAGSFKELHQLHNTCISILSLD